MFFLDFQNRASKKKGTKDGNVIYRIIIKLPERKYFLLAAQFRGYSVLVPFVLLVKQMSLPDTWSQVQVRSNFETKL
jgi:hypothetical protein